MALVVAAALVLGVARLASDPDSGVDIRLGVDTVNLGAAERYAGEIAQRGPLIFPDASPNRERDVVVNHVGDDWRTGWFVFAARREGEGRECTFEVDRSSGVLVEPCADDAPVPSDGAGLRQYSWEVTQDGDLVIDLR
jgi:hypothetical protein